MTRPARTVFLGSGRFGVEALWRLDDHPDVELVGIVTGPPRPAGRGGRLTPTEIEGAARELGVKTILRPERLRSGEAIGAVLALGPELAVLADYGQLVPRPLLELPHGALNLHPSLLPRHRGASPIPATILAGDTETGVTVMQMDEGLDSGPIVAQDRVALTGTETAPQLEEVLEVVADSLLDRCLGPWLRGEIRPRPQPSHGVTLTRALRREDGRLDPARSAAELERQVRAYQPWPGSFVETPLGRLVVWRASALPAQAGRSTAQPGELIAPGGEPDRLALVTADGLLEMLEAQLAGGRRLPAADLRRGRPQLIGSRVR